MSSSSGSSSSPSSSSSSAAPRLAPHFHCHACNSVSRERTVSPTGELRCPHCQSDFVEEISLPVSAEEGARTTQRRATPYERGGDGVRVPRTSASSLPPGPPLHPTGTGAPPHPHPFLHHNVLIRFPTLIPVPSPPPPRPYFQRQQQQYPPQGMGVPGVPGAAPSAPPQQQPVPPQAQPLQPPPTPFVSAAFRSAQAAGGAPQQQQQVPMPQIPQQQGGGPPVNPFARLIQSIATQQPINQDGGVNINVELNGEVQAAMQDAMGEINAQLNAAAQQRQQQQAAAAGGGQAGQDGAAAPAGAGGDHGGAAGGAPAGAGQQPFQVQFPDFFFGGNNPIGPLRFNFQFGPPQPGQDRADVISDILQRIFDGAGELRGRTIPEEHIKRLPNSQVQQKHVDNEAQCTTCMDSFTTVGAVCCELTCGHIFHTDCIVPWLRRSVTCPVCRAPIDSAKWPEPQLRDELDLD